MKNSIRKSLILLLAGVMIICAMAFTATFISRVKAEQPSLTITDGASIRVDGENNGMRFHASLNGEPDQTAEYRMMIFPSDYLSDYVSGDYYDYLTNYIADKNDQFGTEVSLIDLNCLPVQTQEGGYEIRGSITDVLYDNSSRDFSAIAYVLKDGVREYTQPVTRNLTEIAFAAVSSGDYSQDEIILPVIEQYVENGMKKAIGLGEAEELPELFINTESTKLTISASEGSKALNYNVISSSDELPELNGFIYGESTDERISFENGTVTVTGSEAFSGTLTLKGVGVETKEISVEVVIEPEVIFSIQETAEVDNKKVVSVEETVLYDNTVQLTASLNVDGQDIAQADAGIVWAVTEGQDVASVDSATGIVTGLKEGTAIITATYTDRAGVNHTDTCTVSVNGVVRYGTHEWFNHDSIIATIPSGSSLRYDNVSLTTGETPLIRVQMIPEKLLENADSYNFGVGNDPASPTAPDTLAQRGLRMFYITVSDAEDASNYVTIAVRIYPGDGFSAIAGLANTGVRASTFPAFTPGLGTPNQYTDFYGIFNGDPTNPNCPFGISGGYGGGGNFSFYGGYLDEERYPNYENYMFGFSIEGTSVYLYNNGNRTLVWDLADTTSQAALADSAWGGFTSDKVNISIRGDHFEAGYSEFTLAITELGGAAVSETAVTDMYYHTWINDGTDLGLM